MEVLKEKVKFQKYPTYKNSEVEWLGKIPENWKEVKLKYLAEVKKGILPKILVSEPADNLPPYLSMDYLRGATPEVWVRDIDAIIVEDNELLLLWDGSNAGEFIKSRKGVISSTVAHISFSGIDENFAKFYCHIIERHLRNNTIGMGIPHVNSKILNNSTVLIPSKQEQTAISRFLDEKCGKIDTAIDQKQKLIELLKERKQIIIQNAVTKGLDPNVKMKDSGVEWIGEIPEHWEVNRLKKFIAGLESGVSVNASESETADDDEIGVLKTSCVYGYAFKASENKKVFLSDLHRVKCPIRKGAIIISRMNAPELVGASGLVKNEHPNLFLPDRLWQTIFNKNILFDSNWLSQNIASLGFRNCVTAIATGSSPSMKNISKGDLLNLSLATPPYAEQQEIVKFINEKSKKIKISINFNLQQIEKLKEYKSSLIDAAVTGKVKVS